MIFRYKDPSFIHLSIGFRLFVASSYPNCKLCIVAVFWQSRDETFQTEYVSLLDDLFDR